MSVISDDIIRSLAGFRGAHAPVVSCYLDIDGRRYLRHQDYEAELDALLRQARAQANGNHLSVDRDLQRIEEFVKAGIDRSDTRGLAMFSCADHDLWHVVRLPVPVQNRVVVNARPAVAPLEQVLEEASRIAVLLADRQRARLFVFELGTLTERSELFEGLPRDYDTRGQSERGDPRHHLEELAQQHLRHAAEVAWSAFQEHPYDHLSVGAPDDLARGIEVLLHPYLRERLCGRFPAAVAASVDEIRQGALEMERKVERRKEAVEVAQLREAVATGRRGAAGVGPVLDALADRRIERLLVSQGYHEAGWRCDPCQALSAVGRTCRRCGSDMEPVDDVIEEAVEEALRQSCRVEICVGNADLDVMGRVGALLRY